MSEDEMRPEEPKRFVVPFNYSPITAHLISALKDGKPGDELTDADLAEVCGHPTAPGQAGYSYLATAIKYCRRYEGVVWQRIRGEGTLRCLNGVEKRGYTKGGRDRIRRQARRNSEVNGTIDRERDFETEEQRRAYDADVVLDATMTLFADRRLGKKLEQRQLVGKVDHTKLLTLFTKTRLDGTGPDRTRRDRTRRDKT